MLGMIPSQIFALIFPAAPKLEASVWREAQRPEDLVASPRCNGATEGSGGPAGIFGEVAEKHLNPPASAATLRPGVGADVVASHLESGLSAPALTSSDWTLIKLIVDLTEGIEVPWAGHNRSMYYQAGDLAHLPNLVASALIGEKMARPIAF